MHIVIAALTSLATILWLLDRLGIDLGGLNPWAWRRRSRWRSAFEANPIYSITSPMELAAVLVAATAKADGDMSFDEKQAILKLFAREFRLSEREAASLLASSTHLLGKGEEVHDNLGEVIKPSKDSFTPTQAESTVAMVEEIAAIGGHATSLQTEFVERVRGELLPATQGESQWT